MKRLINVIAFMLAFSLLFALISCADTRKDPDEITEPAVTDTGKVSGTDGDVTAGPADDKTPEETFTIFEDGKFNCVVVFPAEESDLISDSAKAISIALGAAAGIQYPIAMPDKMFKEEKYADRCIILVGKTDVTGTEEFEASSSYGVVTAKVNYSVIESPSMREFMA